MEKIKTIIIVPITLAVLAGGGYYAYRDIIGTGTDLNDDTDLGYTIEELSTPTISSETEVLTSLSVPDLDRMVINNEYLPAEAVAIVEKNIKSLSDELKKNPDQIDLWLDLGIQRKTAGDYEGARDAWNYATDIRPSGSVAFQNLGDLYAYYIYDNEKAEQNFLKAIQNAPSDVYLYFKAVEFYRDVLKDTTKARAIVESGIVANPVSADLESLLSSLE